MRSDLIEKIINDCQKLNSELELFFFLKMVSGVMMIITCIQLYIFGNSFLLMHLIAGIFTACWINLGDCLSEIRFEIIRISKGDFYLPQNFFYLRSVITLAIRPILSRNLYPNLIERWLLNRSFSGCYIFMTVICFNYLFNYPKIYASPWLSYALSQLLLMIWEKFD